MKLRPPLAPIEITWEDLKLGGGVEACFERPEQPLVVEIGPGDDDFLLDMAAEQDDINWLGIEYSRKRVQRAVRRIERRLGRPGHLRLLWRPAADIIGPFLTPARVTRYHIHFPDPWPKAHHARFRLLSPTFLADLAASLTPDGVIDFVTDAEPYAVDVLEAVAEVPTLAPEDPPPGYIEEPMPEKPTVFEKRWRELGRRIVSARFRRVDPA